MGLEGLLSFIKHRQKASFKNVKLKRCRLLIDGKNFAYFLKESLPSHSIICGGDYHSFAKKLDGIFSAFHRCSIEVCIIMDGAIADRRRAVDRATKILESSSRNLWGLNSNNVSTLKSNLLPPLFLDTFIKVAQSHGINVLQADEIADDELIHMSKKFNIPILSCDSDFYLQGVYVIQPESLNFSSVQCCEKTGEFQLEAVAFDPFHFSKVSGINLDHMPFFRITDRKFTSHILKIHKFSEMLISRNREDKNRYGKYSPLHTVSDWLLQHSEYSKEELIDLLLEYINEEYEDQKDKYRANMRKIFNAVESPSKLLSWFTTVSPNDTCDHSAFSSSCERDLSDRETDCISTQYEKSSNVKCSAVEDPLSATKDDLSATEHSLSVREDALSTEEDSLSDKKDVLSARESVLSTKEDALSTKKDALSEREDFVPAEDLFSSKEHSLSPEENSTSDQSTSVITTKLRKYVELPFFSISDDDVEQYKKFKMSRKSYFTRKHAYISELKDSSSCSHGVTDLSFSGGLPVPKWLNVLQNQFLFNSETLDIFLKKLLITTPAVENTSKHSIYETALPLIKIIAAVSDSTYLEYQISEIKRRLDEARAGGDNVLVQQLIREMKKEETLATNYSRRISKLHKLTSSSTSEKSDLENKLVDFRKPQNEADELKKLAKRLRKKLKLADDPERKDELQKKLDELETTSLDKSNDQKYYVDQFSMKFLDSSEIHRKFVKAERLDELHLIPATKIVCISELNTSESKPPNKRYNKKPNRFNGNGKPSTIVSSFTSSHVDELSNGMSSLKLSENGVQSTNTIAHIDDDDSDADVIIEDGSDDEESHFNKNDINIATVTECDELYGPASPIEDHQNNIDTVQWPEFSELEDDEPEKHVKNLEDVPGEKVRNIEQVEDVPGEKVGNIEQVEDVPVDRIENIEQPDNESGEAVGHMNTCVSPNGNNTVNSKEIEFQVVFNDQMLPGLRIISRIDRLQTKILHDEFETALNVLRNDCINLRILAKAEETKEKMEKLVQELGKKITSRMVSKFKLLDKNQKIKMQLKNEWESLSNYEGFSKYDWMAEDESAEKSLVPYQNRLYMVKMRKSVGITFNTYKFENEINLKKIIPLQKVVFKSLDERKKLFYSYLNISGVKYSSLPDELQFVMFVICYWYDNSKVQVHRCHLYTLLISFIRYYFVDKGIGGISSEEDIQLLLYRHTSFLEEKKKVKHESIASILKKPDVKHCAQTALNLVPYEKWSAESYVFCKNKSFLHALSEFQMCYLFLCGLNNCVGNPFHCLSIDKILNCVLSCNVFRQLVKARDENIEMVKMLDDCDHVKKLLDELNKFSGDVLDIPVVMDIFPTKVVEVTDEGVEKITFKRKESTKENWVKEVARLKEKKELEEIDLLAKELGDMGDKKVKSKPKKKTQTKRGNTKVKA